MGFDLPPAPRPPSRRLSWRTVSAAAAVVALLGCALLSADSYGAGGLQATEHSTEVLEVRLEQFSAVWSGLEQLGGRSELLQNAFC